MIKWSKDSNTRTIQVQTVVQMLGFEIPRNEEQMKAWDKAFEGYPYELNIDMIDLDKIWNDEAQNFDSVLHPIISGSEANGVCLVCNGTGEVEGEHFDDIQPCRNC